ncbi:hypothetical protein [Streptomyces sp. 7-21]|jgi:hypothetical protein|uniref:hypothetical protein n=1 Tax=Streptomyces sp. 7-21 TaxID=2802283 RepID=UPI00191FA75C|nr:hypothetical protein [Streptomyces sp. 7-21]MBL1065936.1 hypothetical protein [Streptomyces sp. 7-21]
MLLRTDGLTTTLLEEIIGGPLAVEKQELPTVPAHEAESGLFKTLGLAEDELVGRRQSRLISAGHEVVSINRVHFPAYAAADVIPPPGVPIGQHLVDKNEALRREILFAGCDWWPLAKDIPCAHKEYVIQGRSGWRVHVSEYFNPKFVSVDPQPI